MFSSTILSGWSLDMSWAPPRLDQSHTKIGGDTMCSYNMIKEWDFGLIVLFFIYFFFVGRGVGEAERNCDCLAHHRPHITASSHHATVSRSPNVCMHLRFGSPSFNAHTSHIAQPSWPVLCLSIR